MTELLTPRLHCSQLKQEDWSFFLALQRDPQVMLYIADSRPLSENTRGLRFAYFTVVARGKTVAMPGRARQGNPHTAGSDRLPAP